MGNRIFAPPMNRTLMFIGDTHVGDNPRARWTKFADAFLADTANRPAGIVHIGDLTDQSDAPSIALAKQWWARFPDPKCMSDGPNADDDYWQAREETVDELAERLMTEETRG